MKKHLIIIAAVFFAQCNLPKLAGTSDETLSGTQAKAMIYYANGTPVPKAKISVFDVNDTSRTPVAQAMTDTAGRYSLTAVPNGTYNVWAEKDSLIGFQDSVFISSTSSTIQNDTVRTSGSITAIVGMQPNNDPRSAYVQMLGSDRYSDNVNPSGQFTISGLATGTYRLRINTTLSNYTPTFFTVSALSGKADTLKDTLWLIYTGIPVVTGMKAIYDTVNGIVRLSWGKASYRDFQDYVVFRDFYDSINLSSVPLAVSMDTSFVDSIFNRRLTSGQFSFSDTNDYHFKYRVCIRNNSNEIGKAYKFVDVVAASPKKVGTSFAFTFFHIVNQFISDSASVNDTVICRVRLSNQTRQLKNLVWVDIATGGTVRSVTLDSTKNSAADSIRCSWNTVGTKGLACIVIDIAGAVYRDTAFITIINDTPVVTMTYSPDVISLADTIHIHIKVFDKYGKIASLTWDIGNTGQFSNIGRADSILDTFIIAPTFPDSGYLCTVRLTNDKQKVALDTVKINVDMFKLAQNSAGFGKRRYHSSVVFNNKAWVIAGDTSNGYPSDVWYSEDGVLWRPATQHAAFQGRKGHTSLVFNNKIWIIGGDGGGQPLNPFNDVWSSSDGSNWVQSISSAQFSPRSGHSSVSFNNKMWVIGGGGGQGFTFKTYNDVWYSGDGVIWVQATGKAGFSPRSYHSSYVFDNKIWVVGGSDSSGFRNDVWYSTDGVTWIQTTANAGFSPRYSHSSTVFDNKMWVISGAEDVGRFTGDAWYSTDGVSWIQATTKAGFSYRSYHSSLVFNNKMWVIAGQSITKDSTNNLHSIYNSDVWYTQFGSQQ